VHAGMIQEAAPSRLAGPWAGVVGVRWAAALVMLLTLVGAGALVWFDRQAILQEALATNDRRAGRLATELAHTLDLSRVVIDGLEARLARATSAESALAALRATLAEQAPVLAALPLQVSVRPVLEGDAQAVPAELRWHPQPTRADGDVLVVPLVRPAAPNPHGVRGWSVTLDHGALLRRFEGSRTPQGGVAALFRIEDDGGTTLLARAPFDPAELGRTVRGPLAAAVSKAPRGAFNTVTQLDQVHRQMAYQRVDADGVPLVVAYGVAVDTLLAPWYELLPWVAATLLLLLAALAAGTHRLGGALRVLARQSDALARSERDFRSLADNLPDVVVRFDREGRHRYANPAVVRATGLPPEAFIGKTNAELGMPPETVDFWGDTLRRVFTTGRSERIEFSYPGPQGVRHWESVVALEPAVAGADPTALVISRDISDRKQAEQERERLSQHLLALLDGMSDAFVSLDRQWCYRFVNRKAGRLLGRDPASLLGKHIWTEFPEGVGQPFHHAYERAMNEGVAIELEEYYPPWDAWFESRVQPGADGIFVFFTDISERKRREAELARLHATLQALVEGSTDAIFVKDAAGRYIVANRAMGSLLGRPAGEIIGADDRQLFPAVAQVFRADDERVMQARSTENYEEAVPSVQGPRQHLTTKGALVIDGEVRGVFGISRDITERQHATEALRRSEQRLREAQRLAALGSWELELPSGALSWSDEVFVIFEVDPARFTASYEIFLALIHPEDREAVDQAFRRSVAERSDYAFTHRLRFGDGRVKHVHEQGRSFYAADGSPLRSVGTVQDVTAQVLAEQALRESEASHRAMFEANPHPMWVYDLDTLAFLAVNDAALRQYGWSREQFLRMTIKDIRPSEDVPRLLANVAVVSDGLDEAGTWRHRARDGRLLEVEIRSHTLRFEGRAAELVLALDVTRRNQAERTLRDSEQRLRLALEAANQGLYDLDLRTGEAVVSPEYTRMLGWEPQDFDESNAAWRERLHPDDREAVYRVYEDYVAGRRPDYRVEFRQRMRDGGYKWILSVGRIQERDASGQPLRLLGTHTDLDAIKAAQAAQAAATQRFEKLFQSAPEAISVSDLDSGRFLQVNDAFCELFGHPRQALIGRTSVELDLWTRAQERDEIAARLLAGQAVQGFEGVARQRSGATIEVMFSAERIEFDGQDGLLLMFRDISQRKQLEAALRASEARLSHLLARAPTVIYTARAQGDFAATYYSPNLPQLIGWEPSRIIERPSFWIDHVHPDDRPGLLKTLESLGACDDLTLEYRFQHADGRWLWMRDQVSVQRDAQGVPVEIIGAWIDISERRHAEEAVRQLAAELEQRVQERTAQLAQSETRYRTIFETVPVSIGEEDWSGVQQRLRDLRQQGVADGPGFFAARPDFVHECLRAVKVQRLNRKALALHDVQQPSERQPDLQTFFPTPATEAQFADELAAMWAGQRLFTTKRLLPSVSGRPLSLMMTMSLPGLDDEEGTALVCLVDITEIDRLNVELDRSLARLVQVNRELETFTYSVSHDLKAPLRGIDGYSRLLLTDHQAQLDDEGRRFLGHIRQATQHMGVLIDDLLAYSRLERRELTLTDVPLAAMLDTVLGSLRAELAAAGVALDTAIDPSFCVRGDAQGLVIALRNLIDNALKFTRGRTPPRIGIRAERCGDAVRLSVNDNGVGFDMKFHDRIFSIFQRLHRAEDYPGTGIGLAIVRKAMDRMGGRVWAVSQPGEGSTFTIELPEAAAT